jgi:hypothetical protein
MQMVRNATVLKDRFRSLDGKTFPNPSFQTFAPHILKLNLGGEHQGVDLTRSSAELVPEDPRRENYGVRRKIVVDEIDALLAEQGLAGQTADVKARRAALIKEHFQCTSRTEIEELMPLVELQANFDSLHRALTGQASRYGVRETPAPHATDNIHFLESSAAPAAPATPPAAATADGQADALEDLLDPREALVANIERALANAPNLSLLRAVAKNNEKHRKALEPSHIERLDAAIAANTRRLQPAKAPVIEAAK